MFCFSCLTKSLKYIYCAEIYTSNDDYLDNVILYKMIIYVLSRQYHKDDTEIIAQIKRQNSRIIKLMQLRSVVILK